MKKVVFFILLSVGVSAQIQSANMAGLNRVDVKLFLQYGREILTYDTTENVPIETFIKACVNALKTKQNTFTLNVPARVMNYYAERIDNQIFEFEEIRRKRLQAQRLLNSWRVSDPNLYSISRFEELEVLR